MIIQTAARIVHSSFYLTTSLIGTLISALPPRSQRRVWRGLVIVKHRLTVTPVASVVVSDMLLSLDPCRRFVEALTRCCRVPFDVSLNEATPISSLRQGETAAHLLQRGKQAPSEPCLFRGSGVVIQLLL